MRKNFLMQGKSDEQALVPKSRVNTFFKTLLECKNETYADSSKAW